MRHHHRFLRKNPRVSRSSFTRMVFLFSLFFAVVLALTMSVVTVGMLILNALDVIAVSDSPNLVMGAAIWALASLIVGTLTALLVSHVPIRSFHNLVEGMNRLAKGDYAVRLQMRYHESIGKQLAKSFNALAAELENTEMLRSDFVNNFSHEFKTPIVSILGFAKLLKRKDLPPEKREEYLDIILNEATRLTDMSDNVLNLAKIEKQSILTEVAEFNLSEQIRTCVLLLTKKWEQKRQEIDFDEYEYHCTGNEELLKQVWINLLDNAVKFTPEGGRIRIGIRREPDGIRVSFASPGEMIAEETRKRIFEKFFQGDSSHATEGTGLGLAIVRKIAELHKGGITVDYADGCNVFTVAIPQPLPDSGLEDH